MIFFGNPKKCNLHFFAYSNPHKCKLHFLAPSPPKGVGILTLPLLLPSIWDICGYLQLYATNFSG